MIPADLVWHFYVTLGIIHDDLKTFLEANVPTGKKKSKVLLGVSDAKLGAAIQETVNIQCESGGLVLEVLRGIRFHFEKMIKGLTGPMAAKAQLGLGHSYSRAKVKFNVHRVDNMIIQSISLLDQLDKDINTFSMRIRCVQWSMVWFGNGRKISGRGNLDIHYCKDASKFGKLIFEPELTVD